MGQRQMRQATAGGDDWVQSDVSSILPTTKGENPVKPSTDTSEGQRELWNRVRARLKAGVGEDVFASWFARLELEELVEDVVHLSAPTRFLCSWVQSNYADRILEAFRQDDEQVTRIQVTLRVNGQARPRLVQAAAEPVANAEAAAPTIVAMPAPTSQPRLVRDNSAAKGDALAGSAIDPRMTFDSFVPGSANEMALGVARQIAAAAANNTVTFNPVYIHSTVGLGKSHLLNAIAHAVQSADASKNIVYLTADHRYQQE